MPAGERRAALEAGLEAYGRGDYFLAHELLEPAWMGTRDLPERELIQGVIKVAAAFVHGARSNPAGIEKNLRGARDRVANGLAAGPDLGIDAAGLLEAIEGWLENPRGAGAAIPIRRVTAGGAPARR
jgi:Domain of unknown function (DUF309).